jgi:cytochrome d ubiquinol oxidase subunit I
VLLLRRDLPRSRWFYRIAALAGVGAYVSVESGWITTEVGRQPWIVYGAMRVADAVTSAPAAYVWTMLTVLIVIYAAIAIIFVTLLLKLAARWRHDDFASIGEAPEQGIPYGPR